ncbi:MAG: hypothetical protein WAT25_20290 [Paracoccaceae bacterium]
MTTILMLGSAPIAARATDWGRAPFDRVLAINNAHAIRADWDFHIHPWDFPADRVPQPRAGQRIVTEADFVPAQNAFGGFVYGGGTMAFTAAYWALQALRPRVIAAFGCDMHYPADAPTHFYGTGTADPLRADITLRSLEAKSARLMVRAALQGCAMVNLSDGPSRLVFPRRDRRLCGLAQPLPFDRTLAGAALAMEARLGYTVPSGRYWHEADRFDPAALDRLDALWLAAAGLPAALGRTG